MSDTLEVLPSERESAREISGRWISALSERWQRLSLAGQFAAVATLVIGVAMLVLGIWVAHRIERAVLQNSASSAALYVNGYVEPRVQDLATSPTLSPEAQAALGRLIHTSALASRLTEIKIWSRDGRIVYASRSGLIGKTFPMGGKRARAWDGQIEAVFDDLDHEEDAHERGLGVPLLEIYAPLREAETHRIIAVAEFYEIADKLAHDLYLSRLHTAVVVGTLSLLMIGTLFGVVLKGSMMIESQQVSLDSRIRRLSELLEDNRHLQQRVGDANRRASETSERFLRRVGAELHDGPAQLIGLALLRLDGLRPTVKTRRARQQIEDLEAIRGALRDALAEIRHLSAGLALPELEGVTLPEALEIAIRNHERRSRTTVETEVDEGLPKTVLAPVVTACYRLVQEALNNSYRHAGGIGQRVVALREGSDIVIAVIDNGPGITSQVQPSARGGLGLAGLRDRIESLGGRLTITSEVGSGTSLTARIPINPMGMPDE